MERCALVGATSAITVRHSDMRAPRILAIALLSLLAAPAAGASAAPPPNDGRASAQAVPALPAYVIGTLVEATTAPDEAPAGSVWYRYVAATDGRFTATFKAFGDLDAVVDAFRQQRSQLVFLDTEESDAKGDAGLSFRVKAGQTVLIRVSRRPGSVADRFSLLLSAAAPEVKPPGDPLARGGVTSTLDRVLRPAEAYSYAMREGVTYRVNVVPITPPKIARPAPDPDVEEDAEPAEPEQPCRANVALYAPGTPFADRPEFTVGCDDYRLFTPRAARAVATSSASSPLVELAGRSATTSRSRRRGRTTPRRGRSSQTRSPRVARSRPPESTASTSTASSSRAARG